MGTVSEQQKQADNRARATTDEFRAFVRDGWAPRAATVTGPSPAAGPAAARRSVLGAAYPRQRLIVPAGGLKVRSNDTDYVFRPHSAFAHLTGLGADREPDAVLVLEPTDVDCLLADGLTFQGKLEAATCAEDSIECQIANSAASRFP